jgi:hypothetical protein
MTPPEDKNLLTAQVELEIARNALQWAAHDLGHYISKREPGYRKTLLQRLEHATNALANALKHAAASENLERDPRPGCGWIPAKELASG